MLRRCAKLEVFAALFLEAGRCSHGGPVCDAGILATRCCRDTHAEQEAACRAVSARRCRWPEYRRTVRRAKLLPAASVDCHPAAEAGRWRRGDRPRRIFWFAPEPRATRTPFSQKPARDR